MHSLTLKLTLSFLVVALIGVLLVALFVGARTRSEFDQFVADRYRQELVERLATYYQQTGGWEGLQAIAMRMPARTGRRGYWTAPVALVDADRRVVVGTQRFAVGQQLSRSDLRSALPIEVQGKTVGYLVVDVPGELAERLPPSPETAFLNQVNRAIALGALGATALALVAGVLLASAISRPVKELTEATQRVAQGDLGHQVAVTGSDELAQLAASFNRMSADLARSAQARRQMTADIAHELRTPLSVILGYTEALADGKLQGSPAIYEAMYNEARLLSHLVDDLRTLSLADAGELPLNRLPTPPAELLERTAASHAALAAQRGVRLETRLAPGLPPVAVDRERMAQVLANLVSNALRYTPAGGTVTLSAEAQGERVLLRVRDTGPGIEPEHLPHIFDRFYRADPARTANGESGLGLAIAKSLVEAHGGAIWAESTPGQGATFTVSLPAAAPDEQAGQPVAHGPRNAVRSIA